MVSIAEMDAHIAYLDAFHAKVTNDDIEEGIARCMKITSLSLLAIQFDFLEKIYPQGSPEVRARHAEQFEEIRRRVAPYKAWWKEQMAAASSPQDP